MGYSFSDGELRRLQLRTLDMLEVFKDFCDKNGLLFYLCGGCCIGAVREGGFIAWDDDADVFMPREDYERLHQLWQDTDRYALLHPDENRDYGNIFTTLVDKNTTCIREQTKDIDMPHGIAIDIFPLDGCPTGWRRKVQKLDALIYSLFLAQVVPVNHGKLVKWGGRLLLACVPKKKARRRIWLNAQKRMSRYPIADCEKITELCAGPHYMQKEYPKGAFASAFNMNFEGKQMPVPVGYDDYLSIAFGDYMTPPPADSRQPEHDIIFLDLDSGEKK